LGLEAIKSINQIISRTKMEELDRSREYPDVYLEFSGLGSDVQSFVRSIRDYTYPEYRDYTYPDYPDFGSDVRTLIRRSGHIPGVSELPS